ncbi:5-hydroxytryptamine receptor-like [Cherax quadricarinatus]|uniref:5-hydroxytryptamine receptor-like n=1 Tax=Cherax quadricarinatus TaxID=27406 RepID=UPI00387EDB14
MTEFFCYRSLLCDRQYGFRKGYFAADLLLNLSTKWHQSLDESKVSCVVALDVAGAFNRVWHQGLLAKLQALGIAGSALSPQYWAVTQVDYIHSRNGKRIGIMILMVWLTAVVVSIAPLFGWKDPDFLVRVNEQKKCLVSQDLAYQVFATMATFYVPLTAILILYWKIFQAARKRIHKSKFGGKKETKKRGNNKKPKIITGAFVICWLPFFVTALLMPICPACYFSDVMFSIFLWLGYFNSTLNPIIYTIFSPEFREAFKRILFGRKSNQRYRPGKVR